jgi:hypothetical protein
MNTSIICVPVTMCAILRVVAGVSLIAAAVGMHFEISNLRLF